MNSYRKKFLPEKQILFFNPTALRKAKIVYNFIYNLGLSECNRVKRDSIAGIASSEVTVLNLCTSSRHALYLYQVFRIYLEQYQSYTVDMVSILKITKWNNSAKR